MGVPPAAGRLSVRRAASSTAANASCWRCPWVRSSATTCSAGRLIGIGITLGLEPGGLRLGQRPEEGGEFLSDLGGEAEVAGPGAVLAVFEVEEPAESVFGLVGGQHPVGIDGVDQLRRDPVEILVAQLTGLLDQQQFSGFDGGGVAVLHLAQGGVDQGDLLGGDESVALRGGEVGPDRGQRFAGHAGAVGEVFGGFDPSDGFAGGESEPVGQHRGHGPFRQDGGHPLLDPVLDHGPVDDGQLVPDPFQGLQGVDQSERAEIGEGAVVDELDQVFDGDVEGVHRGVQRGGCRLVGGGLDHALILVEQSFHIKTRKRYFSTRQRD